MEKILVKRNLIDPSLVEPQAEEDHNQSSPIPRVVEKDAKRVRLDEIAERVNEPVPGFSGVLSNKRKKGNNDE